MWVEARVCREEEGEALGGGRGDFQFRSKIKENDETLDDEILDYVLVGTEQLLCL